MRSYLVALFTLAFGGLFAFSAGPALAAEPATLRVMTYNIHHGEGTDNRFDLDRLAKIIRDAQPDLVALQEVDRRTDRASGVDQAEELARKTGMHMAFGNSISLPGGDFGNAVLSRLKLGKVSVHKLPSPEEGEPRVALAVAFEGPGRRTSMFVSTHLCHLSEPNRLAQVETLEKVVADFDGLVILAGDLNARPGSAPMQALLEDWRNPLEDEQTIDYVLVREHDGWRPISARKIAEPIASDHDPVVIELAWPESP